MADTNPIKYSDLVQPDNSIETLIKQLEELKRVYSDMLKMTQGKAQQLVASLKQVSGATEEGRSASVAASKEADKLARAQEALREASSKTSQEIERLKAATAEQNRINKLNAKQALATKDSYDYLSAQWSKNEIELQKLSEAERKNTKYGRELEAENKKLMERMNALKVATGKYTLQVGNYNIAADSMKSVIKQGKDALNEMARAGKQNTAEYKQMAAQLAVMTDQMDDTNTMIKNMASDTATLDAVLQAAAVGTGGFAAVTGAMELFGGESKEVEEAQRKLQAAIALVNGVTAIQNALQKQSALVTKLKAFQDKVLGLITKQNTATTAANTVALTAQTAATKTATTATSGLSKALNTLKSNPVILALTAIVALGGLTVAIVKKVRAAQKEAYEQELKNLEVTEARRKVAMQAQEKQISDIQQNIKLAQAEGKSEQEILKLRQDEFVERSQMAARNTTWNKREIDALEENKKKLLENNATLKAADAEQIKLKKYKREEIEAENALLERQIEIAEQQIAVNKELEVEALQLAEEQRQLTIATAQADEESFRALQDAKFALMKNQYARERAITKANYERQVADLNARLQNEKNLTETQRRNINALIIELEKTKNAEISKLNAAEQVANLTTARETMTMWLSLQADGMEKDRALLLQNYQKQTDDLRNQLQTDKDLTLQQRQALNVQLYLMYLQYLKDVDKLNQQARQNELNQELKAIELRKAARIKAGGEGDFADLKRELEIRQELELQANRQLAKELQQDETAIRAKYAVQYKKAEDNLRREVANNALNIQQELAKSEIDLMKTSENKKNAERLKLEKQALEQRLKLNEEANIKMADEEVQTIKNKIAKIDQEIKKEEAPQDIYDILGLKLDDEQKDALDESFEYAKQAVADFYDYKLTLAQQAVDMSTKEVEAAQNALNAEKQARAAGYANNVAMAEKELAAAKQQQRKALKQQEETQKQQQKLQALEQAVNMVTASAKVFSQFGMPWAIPVLALMWGTFIATKIRAKQLASEQYGEGTVELLEGGSHQSGNDIDLGTKKDGTKRRAEGGEYFAVINKRSSRKYRKEIPNIINALNNDTFAQKYARAYDGAGQTTNIFTFNGSGELKTIAKGINEINERQKTTVVYTADGWIEKRGNITRIIHK